ncbi:MAG: AAA family ATPase [Deltaproteobacteria bacterium]|nr:AAA family ATPase [Deltaproteobacteria bacterium]
MKIIKLQAENYKVLKAVTITPEGNTVIISGKNGQGKTSTLDTIWAALSGGEAGKKNKKPIREGEDHAMITLDLGDLIVTRKWTSNEKSYLTVENKEGANFKSPQSILDNLVGRLTFDPLEFANLKNKEQVDALLETIDLDIDLDTVGSARADFFTERTDVKREVKRLDSALSMMAVPEEGMPIKEVSATDILNEIEEASSVKRMLHCAKDELMQEQNSLSAAQEELMEKVASIEQLKIEISNRINTIATSEEVIESIKVPDIEVLETKLKTVEETNKAIRNAGEYNRIQKQYNDQTGKHIALTMKIEELDKKKADAIKAAKMPVDGLSFDEDGLTLKGVPFAQVSSAEQLRVSVAMAMAINPKLRVLRITDGSLLDSDSMKIIEQMATDNDFQIWIEVVDDTGKVGIYIEDGEIANGIEQKVPA